MTDDAARYHEESQNEQEYNSVILFTVIEQAKTKDSKMKRIVFYDPTLSFILRSLIHSIPKFSMSYAAGELVEMYLDSIPENSQEGKIWGKIKLEFPSDIVEGVKFPVVFSPTKEGRTKAYKELKRPNGAYITIFSPKLASYFRYMQETISAYSLSRDVARIIKISLNNRSEKILTVAEKMLREEAKTKT